MKAELKKLESAMCSHLFMAILLLFTLSCSAKYQSENFPILLARQSDIPVSVVDMQFLKEGAGQGNLQIQIKNVSQKPIKAVRYWLSPMPCRQYDMPSLLIDYGDSKLLGSKNVRPADPILNPGQNANLFVERKQLEDYLNPKRPSDKCWPEPEEKPHLFLAEVLFDDGTAWKIGKQNSSK